MGEQNGEGGDGPETVETGVVTAAGGVDMRLINYGYKVRRKFFILCSWPDGFCLL